MVYLMNYVVRFLREGWWAVVSFLPLYGLWRLWVLFPTNIGRRVREPIDFRNEWVRLLLFCYLMMLFTQTFADYGTESEWRLVPFQMIGEQTAECFRSTTGVRAFLLNIVGNIAVFVPIGWLTAILSGGRFFQTLKVGFFLSLFIEIVQIPLSRTTDVDDLILNTTGAVIGYGCYRIMKAMAGKREKR